MMAGERAPRILVVGSINMDLTLSMEALPRRGESAMAERYAYHPGGKGSNQAVAAARLGAETAFCGRIGKDDNGRTLRAGLSEAGVEAGWLTEDETERTGLAVVMVEADGANRIVVYPSANMRLGPEDVRAALDGFAPDAVLIQLEIPQETVMAACRMAADRGVPVWMDAGPAQAFDLEALQGVYVLSPNETETEALCGISPDTQAQALRAAELLQARCGAEYVVIKRGGQGAFLYHRGGAARNYPAHAVKAVDTTAAGDAFMAGLLRKYLETRDMDMAMRYAGATGALTVTRAGAQPSLPYAAEVDAFWDAVK